MAAAAALATGLSLAAVTVPVTAATTAGSLAGTCTATYRQIGSWNGGFQSEVVVTNPGTTPLTGWTVTLTLPAGAAISSLWNGVNSGTTGTVTVANAGYNGAVGAGQSTSFGFTGTGSGSGATASCPTGSSPTPTPTPPGSVLAQAHTTGRVKDQGGSVQYTWPGVSFEGRFHGTGVGIVLNDAGNDYDIQIDNATPATLRAPGRTTHWIGNLGNADHTVRIAKRTEGPWAAGEFGGFVAASGGSILAKPAPRTRQIEFIGDSWTAGYGNMSTNRDCGGSGGVNPNSNADQTFGALAARGLNADYQITAWSGMGMVRNYNGGNAGTDFRTYYDRTLQAVDTSVWQKPSSWKPQVIVIGLGINDFSTALNSGEPWANADALAAAYRSAYLGFLDKLRTRYGSNAYIVLTYPTLSNTTAMADSVQQIVQQRNSQGDSRVKSLHYDNAALGLDLLGCDWHPSLHDHRILAGSVTSFLGTLAVTW
ncbi:hypothetical protein GCM10022419_080030 [Nonomuraea rosea]|uniref:CBM2 domain-containing protein n=1 Tax=Nonomuraea rosea TaxID=638574 RepID=A0ABP6YMU3_9ACTN